MTRRSPTHRAIAMFAVLLVLYYPWSAPAFAGRIIAVSGTVDQSGAVTPGATAIANPPGLDETQGVIEIDLAALQAFVPGSTLGEGSLGLVVRFDVAKTFEVRTYTGDLDLNEFDFGAGGAETPFFSHVATEPTDPEGLAFTLDLTSDDLIRDGGIIGFNLRESESSGNVVTLEYLLVATIVALGAIAGLAAVESHAEPMIGPDGLPTGLYEFSSPEVTFTPVPEPASGLLLLLGAVFALVLFRRRYGV